MTEFNDVFFEATKWLAIPGVETVIPNHDEQSIMVLTSCSSTLLTDLIPEELNGYSVYVYYVHGLDVKARNYGVCKTAVCYLN